MNKIRQFLADHKLSAHTLAAIAAAATTLWATDPAFKDYVFGLYNAVPKGVHEFIVGVGIPVLVYWKSQKKAAN